MCVIVRFLTIYVILIHATVRKSSLAKGYGSRIHFEDLRFKISLVTAISTRIQSEDVLHGTHVIHDM
jgi:hypothetical protein